MLFLNLFWLNLENTRILFTKDELGVCLNKFLKGWKKKKLRMEESEKTNVHKGEVARAVEKFVGITINELWEENKFGETVELGEVTKVFVFFDNFGAMMKI